MIPDSTNRFITALQAQNIPHTVRDGALEIERDVSWTQFPRHDVPDNLVVHGALDLSRLAITRLPKRLVVDGDLIVDYTPITRLPPSLSVGGTLSLGNTRITTLPDGFEVMGSLYLSNTPIAVLPEGLNVWIHLHLEKTRIQSFPTRMHVSGTILPPDSLLDLHAFMRAQPDEVVLPQGGSYHHRLQLHSQLQAYPDLGRVVRSIGPAHQLRIRREANGHFDLNVERAGRV